MFFYFTFSYISFHSHFHFQVSLPSSSNSSYTYLLSLAQNGGQPQRNSLPKVSFNLNTNCLELESWLVYDNWNLDSKYNPSQQLQDHFSISMVVLLFIMIILLITTIIITTITTLIIVDDNAKNNNRWNNRHGLRWFRGLRTLSR